VASVRATSNAGADIIVARDNVNQLSLALVTPLRANDHINVATLVVVVMKTVMLLVQQLMIEGGGGDDGSLLVSIAVCDLLRNSEQYVEVAFACRLRGIAQELTMASNVLARAKVPNNAEKFTDSSPCHDLPDALAVDAKRLKATAVWLQ
jgi:hypothetical protein